MIKLLAELNYVIVILMEFINCVLPRVCINLF
jgi:hypothetical protein